jgi:phosphomannomutase
MCTIPLNPRYHHWWIYSPIGWNCSQEERMAFFEYDKTHRVRETMVKKLEEEFGSKLNLQFSIGGQISIDCFIKG